MSMAGAQAQRRGAVEREFAEHAREITAKVAEQFQPVYERAMHRAKLAEERAAVLQTCVELVALGMPGRHDAPEAFAQAVLDQLGIIPDIQVLEP